METVTPSEILSANDLKTKIVHLQNRDFPILKLKKLWKFMKKL